MNAKQQAKNGFKTFLITFIGSLVIFGSFYYFLLEASSSDVSIEETAQSEAVLREDTTTGEEPATSQTLGGTEISKTMPEDSRAVESDEVNEVMGTSDSRPTGSAGGSPFAYLAAQEVNVEQKAVLAGTSETTQSSVPSTGLTSMTVGFVASIALFSFFIYIVFLNPRSYALARFEKRVMKDLEK